MADEQQQAASPDTEAPAEGAAGSEGAEGGDAALAKAGNGKLFMMIGAAVLVVLIGGGVAGYFLMSESGEKHEMTPEELAVSDVVFYELPPMTVPITGEGGEAHYLKAKLTFELGKASDAQVVEKLLPRLQDDIQNFFRQLRAEDVQGSVAIQRLKEALLLRANQMVAPVNVRQVLLRELLVQ